jgi:hypothetical protein
MESKAMKEEHVAYVRNDARSKVEIIFVKDGWTVTPEDVVQEKSAVKADAYILRHWSYKEDGKANVKEIRLSVPEMKNLQNATLEEEYLA